MLIEEVITRNNVDTEYDISRDNDYIHIDYSESSATLYDYIKEKAISTFRQLSHTATLLLRILKHQKMGNLQKFWIFLILAVI